MPSSFFKLFTRELVVALDSAAAQELEGLAAAQEELDDVLPTIGLLSTPELENVIAECKSDVARIAKQCRARNSRYRCVTWPQTLDIILEA
jgi:hypothetical protein